MEQVINLSTKVSDIVIKIPQSDKVLKSYKIDFCCGGNRPLQEAVEEKNLPADEVLAKIHEVYVQTVQNSESKNTDWQTEKYSKLIDHVIDTHHRYLVDELPQLSMYVTKVFRVHGDTNKELEQVYKLFHDLKQELELHLVKEEKDVFPHIVNYENEQSKENLTKAVAAIHELEREHEAAGDLIKTLREVTNDFTPPLGACTTYRLTYQRLEDLEADLFQHIHLENNILFPRLQKEQ